MYPGRNNVTLDRIYHLKEINTSISKNNRHNLLLCTIYQQNDGEAMGLPLGPVLAGILMAESEMRVIPMVTNSICHWTKYVDDIIVFTKNGNPVHENI